MERITVKQYFEVMKRPARGNKYGAKKTEYDGHIFDSKHEAKVAEDLQMMKLEKVTADRIVTIEYHPPKWDLLVNGQKITHYTADFRVTYESGKVEIIDAKSPPTRKKSDYRMRKKLMKAIYDIEIIEK